MGTVRTTSSTTWQHVENFTASGLDVEMKNIGSHDLEVECREIFDDQYVIRPGHTQRHEVLPYCEVWFRSISGNPVTVDVYWGPNQGALKETELNNRIEKKVKKQRARREKLEKQSKS